MTVHAEPVARYGDEASRLHAALFGQAAPVLVQQRFAVASEVMERSIPPEKLEWYHRALERVGDLEALDVAARYLRHEDLLFRKFRLMVYLAEVMPENQHLFINEHSSFVAGFFRSAASTLRTLWKLFKGAWLLRAVRRA